MRPHAANRFPEPVLGVACSRVRTAMRVAVVLTVWPWPAFGADRFAGPWNLESLRQPPATTWAQTQPAAGKTVRALYYQGEPYEGHPTRVFAYYARPEGKAQVPGMVLVHGGGGKAFREWAELWADRGYAAIAMDLAGRGPDGQRLPDGGPDQDDARKFGDIARGVKVAWPYHAVAAVIRAHSLLRSLPDVDTRRTGITGISWGGYLTCIAAGLDDRFQAAVPVYGCGFLHENSVWLDAFKAMTEADRKLWVEQFDPSRYLAGAAMPVLFVNGTNDFAYPLDSYQKSYRLVQKRTLSVTVRLPHSHPDGWAPREIGLFIDSVLGKGKPLATLGPAQRNGRQVSAEVKAEVPLRSAALCYTRDTGAWQKREWHTTPARLDDDGRTVRAELPDPEPTVWFLTVTDDRGATTSTEHEVKQEAR